MSADPNNSRPDAGGADLARTLRAKLWVPALLMAVVVGLIWSPNLLRPPPPAWTIYTNVKGQIRRIVLADKSAVRLNGASQVRVVYEDDDRRAALGQAEAAFTMTQNDDRPFLISSGDRVIEMDGGEINVLRETSQTGARTVLTVRQGQAKVYPEGRATEGVAAGPGQQVSWTDGQALVQVRSVNAANAFAWESHRLAYDKAPLSEVVADLKPLCRPADPHRRPGPGPAGLYCVLDLEGEDVMLRKIGAVLPVEAKALPAEILLQRARPKAIKPKKTPLVQSLLKLGAGPSRVRRHPPKRPPRRPRSFPFPRRRRRPDA